MTLFGDFSGGLAFLLAADDPASLDRLVDIVAGPSAPWWPPAPGWYVVVGVLAAGLLAVGIRLGNRWHRNAYRRAGLRELERITAASSADADEWRQLSGLLKRVALAAYPRAAVANLAGAAWLEFLDETAGRPLFAAGPGQTLLGLAYDPQVPRSLTPEALRQAADAARDWIHLHGSTPPNAVTAGALSC